MMKESFICKIDLLSVERTCIPSRTYKGGGQPEETQKISGRADNGFLVDEK